MVRSLLSELRADVLSGKAVPALSAGFASGLGLLVAQIAFATLIFSGPLDSHTSQGVGLVLFGNFCACLIVALASGYRGAVSGLSPALVIVMASIAAIPGIQGDALFVTAAVALMFSAFATGACCLLIGHFRLANLVRFIPYPVAGGFVAGIGGAVCIAAVSLMGANTDWHALPALISPTELWKWSPGVLYGTLLYLAIRRWRNALILPISVGIAIPAYHLVLAALGLDTESARAAGLLFTNTAEGMLWPALRLSDLGNLDWAAMAMKAPEILTLILVALICVVMNFAGLEVAANQELEWDREFRVGGFASVVAGLGGGTVATVVVPASLRSKLLGASTRLTGIVTAAIIGVGLVLGDGLLAWVPPPLLGGIIVFAGLGMLDEGLVRSRKRLPWSEYSIIVLIFIAIVTYGLLEGVAAGMLATLVFFAVRLSRMDPIETRFTARDRRSKRTRPIPDRAILAKDGGRVHGYELGGYIFFGSVCPLAEDLRQTVNGPSRPRCLILDFAAVSGFDFSAVTVLCRVLQSASESGVKVVLSGVSRQLRAGLERNLLPSAFAELALEPDADRALEHCEDTVLAVWKADAAKADMHRAVLLAQTAEDLARHLDRQARFEDLLVELRRWLDPCEYSQGEALAGLDAREDGLQLLVSGYASARDSAGARLYQCGPGDTIWPARALHEQTAAVVAEEPCRTMVLPLDALRSLEVHDERLALKLYRFLLAGHFPNEAGDGPTEADADDRADHSGDPLNEQ